MAFDMVDWIDEQNAPARKEFEPSKMIVLDTETTGLKAGYDEVLSLAIIDGNGNTLFNELIKPASRKRWPKAQEIHGITWQDVKDKQTLLERADQIRPIIENSEIIIGYNLEYDIGILRGNGLEFNINGIRQFDVMREFAPVYGEWNNYRNDFKWKKLSDCASYYGYTFNAHNALEDCKATLFCYRKLLEDPKYPTAKYNRPQAASYEVGSVVVISESGKQQTIYEKQAAPEQEKKSGCRKWLIVLAVFIAICFMGYVLGGK